MTVNHNILISGAGISGLTLAYWLHQWGFSPVVIERRPNLDDRGYMVDFYGSGFDVAEKMNVLADLQAHSDQYHFQRVSFVDDRGHEKATLDVDKFRALLNHRYFPLLRGDIENVLYNAVKPNVPVKFGVSIVSLQAQPDTVQVELSDGTRQQFDLVIGADGIHSNVRKLVWGAESQFSRYLGFYVACSVIENIFNQPDVVMGHFAPNAQVTVYSIGENKLATFFGFRSPPLNVHTRPERLAALQNAAGGLGWVVPQLLQKTEQAGEFFFDAAAQIEVPNWWQGRVALVGDACQCLTLLAGQGVSMGMAGAYLLASELRQCPDDAQAAFTAYQAHLQPEIQRRQKDARGLAGSFIPRNGFEIALTHLFLKMAFWPGFGTLFAKQIGIKSLVK